MSAMPPIGDKPLQRSECRRCADIVEKLICCGGWLLLIHSTENESGGSVDDGRSAGDAGELVLSVSVGRPRSRRSHAPCHRPLRRSRWVEAAPGAVLQHDRSPLYLSLIHISEPTRQAEISYAV